MRTQQVVAGFCLPDAGELTDNERAWVGFLRDASKGTNPAPTLAAVQAMRQLLDPSSGRRIRTRTRGREHR